MDTPPAPGRRRVVLDGQAPTPVPWGEDERLTFAQLDQAAAEAAAALVAAGTQPGDRIGLWAPNSAEWVVAVLGAYLAGAVVVPVGATPAGGGASGPCGSRGVTHGSGDRGSRKNRR